MGIALNFIAIPIFVFLTYFKIEAIDLIWLYQRLFVILQIELICFLVSKKLEAYNHCVTS